MMYGGFHSYGGYPNRWMVYFRENPIYRMDGDWGYGGTLIQETSRYQNHTLICTMPEETIAER